MHTNTHVVHNEDSGNHHTHRVNAHQTTICINVFHHLQLVKEPYKVDATSYSDHVYLLNASFSDVLSLDTALRKLIYTDNDTSL